MVAIFTGEQVVEPNRLIVGLPSDRYTANSAFHVPAAGVVAGTPGTLCGAENGSPTVCDEIAAESDFISMQFK